MKKLLIFLVAVVALGALYFNSQRNDMIRLQKGVQESWSQVENVYQRRADLIPNLVNTVKGYAKHEQETLTQVIEARAQATQVSGQALQDIVNDPEKFEKFQQAQQGLSSALSRLMAVVERYPDLKANQGFLELQSQLEGTENRIAVERKRFNEVTREYNTKVSVFPGSLIASWSGFKELPFFKAQEGAETAPKVEF